MKRSSRISSLVGVRTQHYFQTFRKDRDFRAATFRERLKQLRDGAEFVLPQNFLSHLNFITLSMYFSDVLEIAPSLTRKTCLKHIDLISKMR